MNSKKGMPNIIFILTDDQGAWAMHCAGNEEIQTPAPCPVNGIWETACARSMDFPNGIQSDAAAAIICARIWWRTVSCIRKSGM